MTDATALAVFLPLILGVLAIFGQMARRWEYECRRRRILRRLDRGYVPKRYSLDELIALSRLSPTIRSIQGAMWCAAASLAALGETVRDLELDEVESRE